MDFKISEEELLKSLKELRIAKKNGFAFSEVVLHLSSYGDSIDDCTAKFDSLIIKAAKANGRFNWGRIACYKNYRFNKKLGKMVPIKSKENKSKGITTCLTFI